MKKSFKTYSEEKSKDDQLIYCNVFQYLIPSYYFSPQVIQGIRL